MKRPLQTLVVYLSVLRPACERRQPFHQVGCPAAAIEMVPGHAYFYLRHVGAGNMTIRH